MRTPLRFFSASGLFFFSIFSVFVIHGEAIILLSCFQDAEIVLIPALLLFLAAFLPGLLLAKKLDSTWIRHASVCLSISCMTLLHVLPASSRFCFSGLPISAGLGVLYGLVTGCLFRKLPSSLNAFYLLSGSLGILTSGTVLAMGLHGFGSGIQTGAAAAAALFFITLGIPKKLHFALLLPLGLLPVFFLSSVGICPEKSICAPIKDEGKERLLALLTAIQPDSNHLDVLILTTPDSFLPSIFSEIPNVASLDVILFDPFSRQIPLQTPLRNRGYDLILLNFPPPYSLAWNRLYTADSFQSIAEMLKTYGVFTVVLPEIKGYSENASIQLYASIVASLKTLFRNVVFTTNSVKTVYASNSVRPTVDLSILSMRAEKISGDESPFPPGLLDMVGGLLNDTEKSHRTVTASVVSEPSRTLSPAEAPILWGNHPLLVKFGLDCFVSYFFVFYAAVSAAVLLIVYFIFRYFVATTLLSRNVFLLMENGFFAAGLLEDALCFQILRGSVLRMDGVFYFGLCAAGFGIGNMIKNDSKPINLIFRGMSLLLPPGLLLLCLSNHWTGELIASLLFVLIGISAGKTFSEAVRSSRSPEFTPGMHGALATGCLAGVAAVSLTIPAFGPVWTAVLLLILRIFSLR